MCSGDIRADIGADRIMITPALSQMVIGATFQARNVLLSPRIRLCWCLQQSTTVTNDSCLYMLPFCVQSIRCMLCILHSWVLRQFCMCVHCRLLQALQPIWDSVCVLLCVLLRDSRGQFTPLPRCICATSFGSWSVAVPQISCTCHRHCCCAEITTRKVSTAVVLYLLPRLQLCFLEGLLHC